MTRTHDDSWTRGRAHCSARPTSDLHAGALLAIETELRELIDKNLPPDSARRVAAFAERLFARESADSRGRIPPDRRLALVQSAWEFFSIRTEPVIARGVPAAGDDALTIIETVTTDSPFIIDSLLEYFHHLGATVRPMLHPIIRDSRDRDRPLVSIHQ